MLFDTLLAKKFVFLAFGFLVFLGLIENMLFISNAFACYAPLKLFI